MMIAHPYCSDLVGMTTNPVDWPTFATEIEVFYILQEDFKDVCLSHIFLVGMVGLTR